MKNFTKLFLTLLAYAFSLQVITDQVKTKIFYTGVPYTSENSSYIPSEIITPYPKNFLELLKYRVKPFQNKNSHFVRKRAKNK